MLNAFKNGKDIYATIASLAFNYPYEECMEFNPITGANQPEGKERRMMPTYLNFKPVDTTGAGDSFCAGFIAGLAQGWDYYESAAFANADHQ